MRWVPDWLHDVLAAIGLMEKNVKLILLVSLDNAGKSTLLRKLAIDRRAVPDPLMRPKTGVLLLDKLRYLVFDLGGTRKCRPNWGRLFPKLRGVMFMVDVTDWKRFEEAKEELHALLETEELARIPFAVLANKTDTRGGRRNRRLAVSEAELRYRLDLHQATSSEVEAAPYENADRPIGIFMCSLALNVGYGDAVYWLLQHM